jgi:hypothetical protein
MKVAAAVAAVLGSGAALAQTQTAENPFAALYISGSSAAQPGVFAALAGTAASGSLCQGKFNYYYSTGDKNFFAISCAPTASSGLPSANGSNIYTFWYRTEGGSVTGVLPIVSGSQINQLNLTTLPASSACPSGTPAGTATCYALSVTGGTETNGVDDTFGGAVQLEPVQLGISDVEPGALVGNNYPTLYQSSAYGHATSTQMAGLNSSAKPLFGQVFGIFVNTASSAFGTAGSGYRACEGATANCTGGLSLSRATIGAILQNTLPTVGSTNNWDDIPDSAGNVITTNNLPITIVNREPGSGSRTATDIFFTGDHCDSTAQSPIFESAGGTVDQFSTGDVLTVANGIAGSITYASIDNAGKTTFPNLTLVAVDNIAPTSLNAATGVYGDWFEATGIIKPSLTGNSLAMANSVISAVQTFTTGPNTPQIVAIPSGTALPGYPVSGTAQAESIATGYKTAPYNYSIYTNPYTRNTNSCNDPEPTF